MVNFLIYVGQLVLFTLGVPVVCGLIAWLAERLFLRLCGAGSERVAYISSVIGTPIHELGHAVMCVLFGHKITEMKLLLPPHHPSGTLGYVSHSYNKKNLWARLGNLFIGMGPIFSGLGVMILVLWLCFPAQWGNYLTSSQELLSAGANILELLQCAFSLLLSMPQAFVGGKWWAVLIGTIVILSVSQHITLSGADIKGSLSAFPLYLLLLAVFGVVTETIGIQGAVLHGLEFFSICLFSLFCIVIAFSLVWIAIALLIYCARCAIRWF